MAGDRRATEGHAIAHRAMDKVFPADRYSAVAIAGAAGPAVEMVRLFQTQLEHYEKVEGVVLSLEGKANQLSQMVREHLPMAMQGLAVVPLFAGYDLARGTGRIFTYDVTGGHYEESEYNATGSGGRDARTTIKLGYRRGLARDEAVELAIEALYEAADEDSATGGPDLVRGIYPLVATVDGRGLLPGARRRGGGAVRGPHRAPTGGGRSRREGGGHDHAVLRRPRAGHEGPGRVRPEGHRPGPVARGHHLRPGHRHRGRQPSRSLHKISEIYDRIAFAGVGKYNEFDQLRVAGIRHADTKGYAYSREDVEARSLANLYAQYLGQVFTHEMKPLEVELLVAELGTDGARRSCTTSPTRGPSPTRTVTPCSAARPRPSPPGSRSSGAADWTLAEALRAATSPWPDPTARSGPPSSRWPSWPKATAGAPSAGWWTASSADLLA